MRARGRGVWAFWAEEFLPSTPMPQAVTFTLLGLYASTRGAGAKKPGAAAVEADVPAASSDTAVPPRAPTALRPSTAVVATASATTSSTASAAQAAAVAVADFARTALAAWQLPLPLITAQPSWMKEWLQGLRRDVLGASTLPAWTAQTRHRLAALVPPQMASRFGTWLAAFTGMLPQLAFVQLTLDVYALPITLNPES